ncbi:MAG: hypothetical protein LC637_02620 [Xanthomonadaceae bacterium]|nr:hypothetical protein [Xanthomonadaceae bacterium]
MKHLFLKTTLVTCVLAMATGCAIPSDCENGLERARQAADERQPAADWLNSLPTHCHTPAIEVWRQSLRTECADLYAFDQGMAGKSLDLKCPGDGFISAWNLGQMLHDLNDEQQSIERRLADQSALSAELRRDLRQRLVVIQRDLPQIQALARIEGFLPPAEIPEQPQSHDIQER